MSPRIFRARRRNRSLATKTRPSTDPVCRTVYGYVLGFEGAQRTVLGVQRRGEWFLPGGPVEGLGVPDCSAIHVAPDCGDPLRFAPLAFHVREQTGLEIVRVGGPFAVNMHPAHGDSFEVSLFYLAVATGQQTRGVLFSADTPPHFADISPVQRHWVRLFLRTGNPLPRPTPWQRFRTWLRPR
jgi:hypothetical protein